MSGALHPSAIDDSGSALDRTLLALSDPIRRRAIEVLSVGPCRAGELASQLKVTPSVMSKHLSILREGGLVSDSRASFDSRVRIYELRTAGMAELRTWLHQAEQGWAEQLLEFKEHLENVENEEL